MIEKDMKLIYKIVWSFVKTAPGLEFDDLVSEACLAYLKAAPKYNSSKGERSTFMWKSITSALTTFLNVSNRTARADNVAREMEPYSEYYLDPERQLIAREGWEELLKSLSPEALMVCRIIFDEPDLYLPLRKPKLCKGIITRELRKRGWEWEKIWGAFKEIKQAVSQF